MAEIARLLLVPILFYLGAKLSLAFAVLPQVLVMFWIPNGILLAGLLHDRWRPYPVFAALVVAAEVAADYPTFSIAEGIAFGIMNLGEVTVAYLLLKRWHFDSRFRTPGDLAKFVAAGPVIAAFLSANGAAAIYVYFEGNVSNYFETLRVWWFSDGLGLLVMTPLVLTIWPREAPDDPPVKLRWFDGVALVATAAILVPFVLSQERVFYGVTIRPMLLIPPMLYIAGRCTMRTTTIAMLVFTALVLFVTKNGQSPFGRIPVRETVIAVQELIFTMCTMALGLTALLSQHRRNARELERRVTERTAALQLANDQLRELSVTDPLTGTMNRRALFAFMESELTRDIRYRHPLAIIVFDIDHFKSVNDEYGHAAGDAVLQRVAAVARGVIRKSDSLARYGGEEFVVVAPETDRFNALQLAERLRMTLRATSGRIDGASITVTASFGVAVLQDDDTIERLLRRADEALYTSKAAGRDRVTCAA